MVSLRLLVFAIAGMAIAGVHANETPVHQVSQSQPSRAIKSCDECTPRRPVICRPRRPCRPRPSRKPCVCPTHTLESTNTISSDDPIGLQTAIRKIAPRDANEETVTTELSTATILSSSHVQDSPISSSITVQSTLVSATTTTGDVIPASTSTDSSSFVRALETTTVFSSTETTIALDPASSTAISRANGTLPSATARNSTHPSTPAHWIPCHPTNLLLNPSFETGNFKSWMNFGGGIEGPGSGISGHNSENYFKAELRLAPFNSVLQAVTGADPYHTYRVSYWYGLGFNQDFSTGQCRLTVTIGGREIGKPIPLGRMVPGVYRHEERTMNGVTDGETLRFTFTCDGSVNVDALLDDISVRPICPNRPTGIQPSAR